MPHFGEKRFKKKDKARIEEDLDQPPSSPHPNAIRKEKELCTNWDYLIRKANGVFGFNGWSHSVTYQSIDYVDFVENKYDVGVSALVKVTLKDGSFHEDVGYGIAKNLKCKGASIERARKLAAGDGLRNSLRAFGTYFESTSHSRKITEFLSPSQNIVNLPSTSGTKRNLSPESNTRSSIAECITFSICGSPSSAVNNVRKKLLLQDTVTESAQLNKSPTTSRVHFTSPTNNEVYKSDCPLFGDDDNGINSTNDIQRNLVSQVNNTDNVQENLMSQAKDSPSNPDKRRRRIKQLQLEIDAREKMKKELITKENEAFVDMSHSRTSVKNEKLDDK